MRTTEGQLNLDDPAPMEADPAINHDENFQPFETIPLDDIAFESDAELEDHDEEDNHEGPRPQPFCFLCQFTSASSASGVSKYKKLETELHAKFLRIPMAQLCTYIQTMYKKLVQPEVPGRPEWRRRTIYRHVMEHTLDRDTEFKIMQYYNRKMMINIANNARTKDPNTNQIQLDPKALGAWIKIQKQQLLVLEQAAKENKK